MYEALASILVILLTPFVGYLKERKTEARDAPVAPGRKRWVDRVRSFKSRIRK